MSKQDVSQKFRTTAISSIGTYAIHPHKSNISFGHLALPVLIRKMADPNIYERKRAVQALCDYLFDPKNVACKEFSDVIPSLKKLTEDEDSEVRAWIAECLSASSASPIGRHVFVKHHLSDETLALIDDEDECVRKAANTCFQRVALSPEGAESLVAAGAVQRLISRIPHEPDYILVILLDTLHYCCLANVEKALSSKGAEAIVPLLKSSCPSVREKAATLMMDLSMEAKGRNRALEWNALSPLLDLCHDEEDPYVQAKALSAIMMISVATPARFMAVEEDAIHKILPLLDNESLEIRLNAIKVLTALAEAPPGRKILLKNVYKLASMTYDRVQEIRRAAKKAVDIVCFVP